MAEVQASYIHFPRAKIETISNVGKRIHAKYTTALVNDEKLKLTLNLIRTYVRATRAEKNQITGDINHTSG